MTRNLVLGLSAAVLLGALALPVGASAHNLCRPHAREQVIGRSARAVLLRRGFDAYVIGCSTTTGKRRRLSVPTGNDELSGLSAVAMSGTVVVLVLTEGDHYGDGEDTVYVDDAIHRGRRRTVGSVAWPNGIKAVAAGEGGAVAWTVWSYGDSEVHVQRRAGEDRTLDRGFALSGLRITAAGVTWRHGDDERSWSLDSPSACALPPSMGTADIDFFGDGRRGQACMRSTGRTVEVPVPMSMAVAGSQVAYAHDDVITVRDLASDRSVDVPAPRPWSIVVDEHGSLAWLAQDPADGWHTLVWVHDAQGTRMVARLGSGSWLGLDGSTIRWPGANGLETLTLAAP